MFNLSRAGSLTFFALYLQSFILFFALAAPVSVTPSTSITVPGQNSYVLDKSLPALPRSLSRRDPFQPPLHASISPVKREIETIVRRGIAAKFKKAFEKVKTGIVSAAKKVGNFIKTEAPKIAKVGLKVVSTMQSVGARVASVLPGIGKPISRALKGASAVTNAMSDAIHAPLGKKLQKGMDVMNKIRNPVSGAAGKALDLLTREEHDGTILHREPELDDLLLDRELDDLYVRGFDMEERDVVDFEDFVQ